MAVSVHTLRARVQHLFPPNEPLRGFVGATNYVLDKIHSKRRWSFNLAQSSFNTEAGYSTGTITATNGSTTITGSGTTWTSTYENSYRIQIGDVQYSVVTVTNGTTIVIGEAFVGTTASGLTYQIYKTRYNIESNCQEVLRMWNGSTGIEMKTEDPILWGRGHFTQYATGDALYYGLLGENGVFTWKISLRPCPITTQIIQYYYMKRRTPVTSVASSIDVPDHFTEMIVQGIYARYLQIKRVNGWRDEDNMFRELLSYKSANDEPLADFTAFVPLRDGGYNIVGDRESTPIPAS